MPNDFSIKFLHKDEIFFYGKSFQKHLKNQITKYTNR